MLLVDSSQSRSKTVANQGKSQQFAYTQNDQVITRQVYLSRTLERNEIEARVIKVLKYFEKVNLREFKFTQTFEELGLDSLDRTALITSIETEFNTLFTDNQFDNFENVEQIVREMEKDPKII